MTANETLQYFTAQDLGIVFDVSPETIVKWSNAGTFPAPIRLSKTVLRWSRISILEHILKLEKAEKEIAHDSN